jgi:hypothetical protein
MDLFRVVYSKLFGIVFRVLGGPRRRDPSSPLVMAYTPDIRHIGNVDFHLSFGFWWEFQWRIEQIGLIPIEIPVSHRIRTAGVTQVYRLKRLPHIIITHLLGLRNLRREFRR